MKRVLILLVAGALTAGTVGWDYGDNNRDRGSYDPFSLEEQQRQVQRDIENRQLRDDIDRDARRREDDRRRYERSRDMERQMEQDTWDIINRRR